MAQTHSACCSWGFDSERGGPAGFELRDPKGPFPPEQSGILHIKKTTQANQVLVLSRVSEVLNRFAG